MQNSVKIIFHIDLNAFFCSVEELQNPILKGKPFAIGNETASRGVISTASYEARKYGVHSALPLSQAKKLCKNLILVKGDYKKYEEYSHQFMELLREYTDKMLPASIDEAYMDVTELQQEIHPLDLAKEIQDRVLEELGLPCSIGIGPTLFLAKMASDMKKPMGITVLRRRDLAEKLWPLSISDMYGVGKKSAPIFQQNGINTIGDFIKKYSWILENKIISEKWGSELYECATGHSSDIVDPERYKDPHSIGVSRTLAFDTLDEFILKTEFRSIAYEVTRRLKDQKMRGKTIATTLRYSNFQTFSKRVTLKEPTDSEIEIFDQAWDLFLDLWNETEVRLIGITISKFEEITEPQIDIFTLDPNLDKEEEVTKILRGLQAQFGEKIIEKGVKNLKK